MAFSSIPTMSWLPILTKADVDVTVKYRYIAGQCFLTVLTLLNTNVYSQKHSEPDTIVRANPQDYYMNWANQMIFGPDWPADIPQKLMPPSLSDNERNPLFFDSLKVKASKYLITKKLFDFVVIPNKPSTTKQISGSSEKDYLKYSGKIIRKIEIRRLEVFGTDINIPLGIPAGGFDNLLNKTHINTIERIIRKNLLFF